jgi:hypothetical protein
MLADVIDSLLRPPDEISLKVGVGASISFLRQQHGITSLARGAPGSVPASVR